MKPGFVINPLASSVRIELTRACRRAARTVILIALGTAALAATSNAQSSGSEIIFSDDFEAPSAGQPAAGGWLNDTGVTGCATELFDELDCDDAVDFPNQDAQHGRDATANDDADGHAGFVFTKLDSGGISLANQGGDYAASPWSCVRDEITGLTWEVKTDDDGLRDRDWTYSWLNSDRTSGINVAGLSNDGQCVDPDGCDTEKYVAAVNAAMLCGHDDWRLPERGELLSIVNYAPNGAPFVDLPGYDVSTSLIDTDYFPNTLPTREYWTATRGANGLLIRIVSFKDGQSRSESMDQQLLVRLVRGGSSR